MGKKYIPVELNKTSYRVYLTNLTKIFKVTKKTLPSIPPYARKSHTRK